VSSIEKEVLAAEMNKKEEKEEVARSNPVAPKTVKVIPNDTKAVVVTGTPAL
jgi:hypothetical protein